MHYNAACPGVRQQFVQQKKLEGLHSSFDDFLFTMEKYAPPYLME